jgi:hypothetical protein
MAGNRWFVPGTDCHVREACATQFGNPHTLTSASLQNKGEAGLLTREQNSHQQLRCSDGSGAIS